MNTAKKLRICVHRRSSAVPSVFYEKLQDGGGEEGDAQKAI
jgi:hypothetical protein